MIEADKSMPSMLSALNESVWRCSTTTNNNNPLEKSIWSTENTLQNVRDNYDKLAKKNVGFICLVKDMYPAIINSSDPIKKSANVESHFCVSLYARFRRNHEQIFMLVHFFWLNEGFFIVSWHGCKCNHPRIAVTHTIIWSLPILRSFYFSNHISIMVHNTKLQTIIAYNDATVESHAEVKERPESAGERE